MYIIRNHEYPLFCVKIPVTPAGGEGGASGEWKIVEINMKLSHQGGLPTWTTSKKVDLSVPGTVTVAVADPTT